MLNPQYEESMT